MSSLINLILSYYIKHHLNFSQSCSTRGITAISETARPNLALLLEHLINPIIEIIKPSKSNSHPNQGIVSKNKANVANSNPVVPY